MRGMRTEDNGKRESLGKIYGERGRREENRERGSLGKTDS